MRLGRTTELMLPLLALAVVTAAASLGAPTLIVILPLGEPEHVAVPPAEQAQSEPDLEPTPRVAALTTSGSLQEQGFPEFAAGMLDPWSGDLDGMVQRRVIRFLLVFNKMGYFLDGGQQRGATYELTRQFQEALNRRLGTGLSDRVYVVPIPVRRDQLIPMLRDGRGDIAASNLTITESRLQEVDFSVPAYSGVSELVVTGPGAPSLRGLEDLAGREIHVRFSSSYRESLERLSNSFVSRGLEPVVMRPIDEYLEDADLLEMVNAGLLPMAIVDSHKAEFWAEIFDDLTVRTDLATATGGQIGWAFRKGSPQLAAAVNDFMRENKQGTLIGNVLIKRYLKDNKWARNALAEESMARLQGMRDLFERYSERYAFDWMMIAAQAFQESRLDHSVRSQAGAIGVMQLLRTTAADPNVGIPEIEDLENNIHAGIKYMRLMADRYFADEDIDDVNKTLFAVASYNAGPARVARLRRSTAEIGLDPDVWFDNVEMIAARDIGRETVEYVNNIYQYYVAYSLVSERQEAVRALR